MRDDPQPQGPTATAQAKAGEPVVASQPDTLVPPTQVLDAVLGLFTAPLVEIAERVSQTLTPWIGHRALIIFTEECTGRPDKKAGDAAITDATTIQELDDIRSAVCGQGPGVLSTQRLGGVVHQVRTWCATTNALLVLVDPDGGEDWLDRPVGQLWECAALSIHYQVMGSPPKQLADSRLAAAERAHIVQELADRYRAALEDVLSALRSGRLTDAAARTAATETAMTALIAIRTASDRERVMSQEPVESAFARLRNDLKSLARYGNAEIELVDPPANGRSLPGEVAHAARAIARRMVIDSAARHDIGRLRIKWDCDGSNLRIDIRDDGAGDRTLSDADLVSVVERVKALGGAIRIESVARWGSRLTIALPLDVPIDQLNTEHPSDLSDREREVLQLAATGARNRDIADALGISENTVKFHVASLLRKFGARTRTELASLAR